MFKKLLSLLLIVCLLSTLVSCGSYNPIIPEEEVGLEDVILVQVNDPEGNILVLAGRDNGEAVMALGEKDENGMTEKITSVFYTTGNEEGFLIELRNDGLPLSLVDTSGTEIIYSNYTDSTVEISIYDNKGNLIAGPTVVEIDPQKIQEIKELFQLYKSGARGWSEIAEIFKAIGLIIGAGTAAAIFMVGTVPAVVVAAGVSLFLIVISAVTSNDVDDVISIGWGAVTCINPLSCIGVASSTIGEAIDIINQDEDGTYALRDIGPAGGYIFYDKGSFSNGWRYLEAAPASTEWEKPWGSLENDFNGETETGIGSGQNNTTIIVTWLNSHSETGKAAQLCYALNYGGYNDWFLPSKDELNRMYVNLKVYDVGGFVDYYYWSSSTKGPYTNAWAQHFGNGFQGYYGQGG
jgi:hypothetical protein